MRDLLLVIVGPTGVGKTEIALRLAQDFSGEIINADSRQVYRFMDIGTDKPEPSLLEKVPHYLIGVINPDEEFSLAYYQRLAYEAINGIFDRGGLPMLVGGTGFYVWAIVEGWVLPEVPPDAALRSACQQKNAEELYQELLAISPELAARTDPKNERRLIRAIELARAGRVAPIKKDPLFNSTIIGLTMERSKLYQRIDERIDRMITRGLISEVKSILEMDYSPELPALSGIGYRQIIAYLQGKLTLEEAIKDMKKATRRLVRQQYNWFRLDDQRIEWFDAEDEGVYSEITIFVREFLRRWR
jgi:tRNA dimethylallyltransferase